MKPAVHDGVRGPTSAPSAAGGLDRVANFPCFDGLRAFAALAVFVYHSAGVFYLQDQSFLPDAVQHWLSSLGFFGVAIFFVISGFLLFRPFALAAFESRPAPRAVRFWKRRFFRIFPAYWAALAVVVYVLGRSTLAGGAETVTAFGLLQNYRYRNPLGLAVAWTLVIEVSFYLVLPALAGLIRRVSDRSPDLRVKLRVHLGALALLAAGGIAARAWYYFEAPFATPARGSWFPPIKADLWLISYLDWFALGMALAVGSAWLAQGGRIPRAVAQLGRAPALSWFLGLGCYWAVVQLALPRFSSAVPVSATQSFLRWSLFGVAAVFFVLPAVFGPQSHGGIRRVLRARPVVMLGVVSYGIYLWHHPLWLQSLEWLPSGLPMALQLGIVLAATVAIAVLSWELLERPILRWSTGRATSLWKGHTTAAPEEEVRDDSEPGGYVVLAGIIVLVALVGLTIGSRDLAVDNTTGAPDDHAWSSPRAAVRDDFDRADQPGLGTTPTGQTWEPLAGTWSIDDGRAVADGPGVVVVRAPVTHIRTVGGGLAFRCADVRNCWWVEPLPAFGTWNIRKIVRGQVSYLGNVGSVDTTPDVPVAVHLNGDQIVVAVDGIVRKVIRDPDLRRAVGAGLFLAPDGGSPQWRTFEAQR